MDTNSLSYRTLKNSLYGLLSYGWPILFSIFVTPILVYKLGVGQFGLYLLLSTITGFVGIVDLGYTNALLKYVSEYLANGEELRLNNLIFSSNTLLFLIGLLFLSIFLTAGYLINNFFPSYLQGAEYSFLAFFLAGLNMFFTSVSGVFTMIPVALQRYDISTKLGIVYLTVSNVAVWLIASQGYGLEGILAAQAACNLLSFFVYYYFSRKILPAARFKFLWVKEEIYKCYKYGFYIFLSNLGLSSFNQLDRLIIPAYLGTSSLTYYSLPGNVSSKISGLTGSITNMFFPMSSGLSGQGQLDTIRKIYKRSMGFVTIIAAGTSLTIATFSYQILYYWISADVANKGNKVLVILCLTFFLIALASPITNFLYGMGHARFLALSSLVMAALNLFLLIFFLPRLNIEGAAWAYFGSACYVIFMIYYMEKKILGLSGRFPQYFVLYFKIATISVLDYFLVKMIILPFVTNLVWLIILGLVSAVLFFVLYELFGFFEKEDRDLIRNFIKLTLLSKLGWAK